METLNKYGSWIIRGCLAAAGILALTAGDWGMATCMAVLTAMSFWLLKKQ